MDASPVSLIFQNRYVKLAICLLAILLLICVLYGPLTNGHLTINTNSSNNVISIARVGDDDDDAPKTLTFQGRQLKATLGGGTYKITVSNHTLSVTKTVMLRARHSTAYELDIPAPINAESVLSSGTLDLAASDNRLLYIDPSSSNLYSLGVDGLPNVVNQSLQFSGIAWANSGFGIGQVNNNQLYVIQNGIVSPLQVPFTYSSASISYSVSSTGMVYVASGGTIYAGQNGVDFKKFFTVNSSVSLALYAGKYDLAVVIYPSRGPSANGPDEGDKQVITINANGKQLASTEFEAGSLFWSPDGDRLAASNSDADDLTVYTPSLVKIVDVGSGSNAVAWLSDTSLVYGQSTSIWEYNISDESSVVLSSTPNQEQVSNLSLSDDKRYVYFTTTDQANFNSQTLFRVGLTAATQNIPGYYTSVAVALPLQSSECTIGYSILSQAYIIINGWTDQPTCYSQAQKQLQNYGLPLSGFTIKFSSSNGFQD